MTNKERLENIIKRLSNKPSTKAVENCVDSLEKLVKELEVLEKYKNIEELYDIDLSSLHIWEDHIKGETMMTILNKSKTIQHKFTLPILWSIENL